MSNQSRLGNLSPKEKEVLHVLSKGATNIQIAKQLNLSVNTVKTHLKHMYKKCNVNSRTELIIKLGNY